MGNKYLIIFDMNRPEEKLPSFIYANNMERICENSASRVLFIEKNDVYKNAKGINPIVESFVSGAETDNLFVLIHNKRTFEDLVGRLKEKINVKLILDYSAGDVSYEAMWGDISRSKNCCELVNKIDFWIKRYTIDPFKRIKHRIINSFINISTDFQFINELIENGRHDEAEKTLREIISNWRVKAISPLRMLLECWELLVGLKNINGLTEEYKKEMNILRNSLYETMQKIKSKDDIRQVEQWRELLKHCQLEYVNENFELIIRGGIGIYQFLKHLEDIIKNNHFAYCKNIFIHFNFLIFDPAYHNEILSSNENDQYCQEIKNFLKETKKFIIWVEELNEKTENLIKWINRY